jgi:5'-3' exonuclease
MGVKGLSKLLRDKHPELFNTSCTLSDYAGKRFAIDVSIFLYKFSYCKELDDDYNFLDKFVCQYRMLQRYGIRCVYIFDGAGEHVGKERERAKRRVQTTRATELRENKISVLTESLAKSVAQVASASELQVASASELQVASASELQVASASELLACVRETEQEIHRLRTAVTVVKPIHSVNLKAILAAHSIPFYEATGEAEKACAWLAVQGSVDVVVSEDYDTLVCGAPVLLRNLGSSSYPLLELKLSAILEALQLSYVEFVDFSILCGTDFNTSLPKIGPVNALKKMREHRCIENVLQSEPAIASNAAVMSTFSFELARAKFLDSSDQLTSAFVQCSTRDNADDATAARDQAAMDVYDEYAMDSEMQDLYRRVDERLLV